MKWSIDGIWCATPAKIRHTAHAVKAACATAAGYSFYQNCVALAGGIVILAFIADFALDFFKEDDTNANNR